MLIYNLHPYFWSLMAFPLLRLQSKAIHMTRNIHFSLMKYKFPLSEKNIIYKLDKDIFHNNFFKGTVHTGANPFINQPFDIIQKFFDRNGSYTLWIRKIRKIRKM